MPNDRITDTSENVEIKSHCDCNLEWQKNRYVHLIYTYISKTLQTN